MGFELQQAAILAKGPWRAAATAGHLELNALVAWQILRDLRRTGTGQIARRGHHHQFGIFQTARHQA
ncbi:hypothetical protein D9M71_583560 [compost metagenome]